MEIPECNWSKSVDEIAANTSGCEINWNCKYVSLGFSISLTVLLDGLNKTDTVDDHKVQFFQMSHQIGSCVCYNMRNSKKHSSSGKITDFDSHSLLLGTKLALFI